MGTARAVSPARSRSAQRSWRQSWVVMGSAGPRGPGPRVLFHRRAACVFLRQTSCFSLWLWNERPARAELVSITETLLRSHMGTRGAVGSRVVPTPHGRNCPDPGGVASKGGFLEEKWFCISFSRKQQPSTLGTCSLLLRDLLLSF